MESESTNIDSNPIPFTIQAGVVNFCCFCAQPDHAKSDCPALHARTRLARRIPPNASACRYHLAELQKADTAGKILCNIDHQSILKSTALFPICNDCTNLALGQPEGSQVLPGIDLCCCAPTILQRFCAYCEIQTLEDTKVEQYNKRIQTLAVNNEVVAEELACACGELVNKPELARICVGCNGLVTAPFHNFAGQEVEFRFASLDAFIKETSNLDASRDNMSFQTPDDGKVLMLPSIGWNAADWEGFVGSNSTNDNDLVEYMNMNTPPSSLFANGLPGLDDEPLFGKQAYEYDLFITLAGIDSGKTNVTIPHFDAMANSSSGFSRPNQQQNLGASQSFTGSTSTTTDIASAPALTPITPSVPAVAFIEAPTVAPKDVQNFTQPMFSAAEISSISKLGLQAPQKMLQAGLVEPEAKRLEELLLANPAEQMKLSTLPAVMVVCGFAAEHAALVPDMLKQDLQAGDEPVKSAAVLWALRKDGFAA